MCGILGFVNNSMGRHIKPALATLSSRGPDEQAIINLGEAVLGHTRLAVIDLQHGHQPMQSPDGRYTLVFNGEIYNFKELRSQLHSQGIVFASDSDTEVLLHALIVWGEEALPRLDGMFAFALWDAHQRTLLAARDYVGIKPLMYSTVGGGLIFASTMAPFMAIPDFPRRINLEALRDYFVFDTPTAPHTFLQDVQQVPPACLLYYDAKRSQLEIKRWWSIPVEDPHADDTDALERVEAGIRESVRRQIVADVPLGAFLSGGIDSSLMVRYMAEYCSGRVKTFSIKFSGDRLDESRYALEVANRFNTDHTLIEADTVGEDVLIAAIAALDQPLADPAYVMTYFLAQQVRRDVTVAISGDGGDEAFGGYRKYLNVEDRHPPRYWHPLLRRLIQSGFAPHVVLKNALSGREYLMYRLGFSRWPPKNGIDGLLQPEIAAQIPPDTTMQSWRALIDELGGHMDSGTLMRADLWSYLSENCLVKTDRASMAHGLEVRVPLLGQTVLPLACALPSHSHFENGLKSLLTGLARKELPRSVWDRPKHGFEVPVNKYITGPWWALADEVIADVETLAPFLNAKAVRAAWKKTVEKGRSSRKSLRIWRLVVLLVWLRTHRIGC